MSKILCVIDGCANPELALENFLRILDVKKIPAFLCGYAEAVACDILVNTNDLILCGSWFALDKNGNCTNQIPVPESPQADAECRCYKTGEYTSLFVFPGMATYVSDLITHPSNNCSGTYYEKFRPQGCKSVENLFLSQLSKDRCLVLWGQAVSKKMAVFSEKAVVLSDTPRVKGIGKLLGMDIISLPADADLQETVTVASEAAERYPFVVWHINASERNEISHKFSEFVLPLLRQFCHDIAVRFTDSSGIIAEKTDGSLYSAGSNKNWKLNKKLYKQQKEKNKDSEQNRIWAIQKLKDKADQLGRLPIKADFETQEIIDIKAALGPWPRALEAAELKEPREKKK